MSFLFIGRVIKASRPQSFLFVFSFQLVFEEVCNSFKLLAVIFDGIVAIKPYERLIKDWLTYFLWLIEISSFVSSSLKAFIQNQVIVFFLVSMAFALSFNDFSCSISSSIQKYNLCSISWIYMFSILRCWGSVLFTSCELRSALQVWLSILASICCIFRRFHSQIAQSCLCFSIHPQQCFLKMLAKRLGYPTISRYILVFFQMEIFHLNFSLPIFVYKTMANRFEYNFTRQSEYQQLRQRVNQLQQENTMLKQSLEELIKVNTQLTESIQELTNNNNINQNNDQIQEKFQMLINENHTLRQQLENEKHQHINQRQMSKGEDEDQTQSLVNVLEELIQSFKNIETKYESQIKDLEERLKDCSIQFEQKIKKVEEQLESKIGTIDAISAQLKHKDQALIHITNRFNQLEKQALPINNSLKMMKPQNNDQIKNLQKRIEKINKELEQKEKVIHLYEGLFNNLKGKIMEKI